MVGADAGYVPSAHQPVQSTTAVQERLSPANRQLIEETRHQTLWRVELAYSFLSRAVKGVLTDEAVGADESRDSRPCRVCVGDIFRHRVRHQEAQTSCKSLVE